MADSDILNENTPLIPRTATDGTRDEELEVTLLETAPFDEQDLPKDDVEDAPSLPSVPGTPEPVVTLTNSVTFNDPEAVEKSAATLQRAILPKTMQVLPWGTFFILSFAITLSAAFYIALFTKMGYGMTTYYFLSKYIEQYASVIGSGLILFIFILYLSDCYYWTSVLGQSLQGIFVIIILSALVILTLTVSASHPYGPISLYVILAPLWMFFIKLIFYKDIKTKDFTVWLSGPFLFNSLITFMVWIIWTNLSHENEWNRINQILDAEEFGCKADFTDREFCRLEPTSDDACFSVDGDEVSLFFPPGCVKSCADIYDGCTNTLFLLWVGPFLVSLGLCFLSFFSSFLRGSGSVEIEATNFGKIWLFLLFALWVSASLAGAGGGISTTLAVLTLSSFAASAIFLANSFTRVEQEEHLGHLWSSLIEKYGHYMDLVRGLLVVACLPPFCVYLICFSFVKQQLRNVTSFFSCLNYTRPENNSRSLRNIEASGWLTIEARRMIREIRSWDRITVYTYAIYIGIGFMSLSVFANKFTTLFLSWLIEKTASMSLYSVTVILICVGTVMFLLPPVPGAPVYLCCGIVILPVGKDELGLVWGSIYAVAVSLGLKLLATVLQQKMIGELLSKNVGVRQMVGINSTLIKAMKLVLQDPGMSFGKVAILCGGPDWPTSVLCGIMGLDLLPILIGTLPIISLVLPTVLTGALTYMSNLQGTDGQLLYPWAETAKALCAALVALVLFANMFFAAVQIEDTIRTKKDELNAIPVDEEVKKADDESERVAEAYKEATKWHLVPIWAKITLYASMISVIASCWMVQIFPDYCFADYELTNSITVHLNGDWRNFIKPLGSLAITLFAVSVVLLQVFTSWATKQAKARLE